MPGKTESLWLEDASAPQLVPAAPNRRKKLNGPTRNRHETSLMRGLRLYGKRRLRWAKR
jgi:hypothetical protein